MEQLKKYEFEIIQDHGVESSHVTTSLSFKILAKVEILDFGGEINVEKLNN